MLSKTSPRPDSVRTPPAINFLHKDRYITSVLRKKAAQQLLQLSVRLRLPWSETRNYEFSKLYFKQPSEGFAEANVVCFRIQYTDKQQRLRIQLPESTRDWPGIVFRID